LKKLRLKIQKNSENSHQSEWDNPSISARGNSSIHGMERRRRKAGNEALSKLARAFVETDASLLEINPLVLTKDNTLLAVDAKLSIDDNALFRQKEIADFYDPSQSPPMKLRPMKMDWLSSPWREKLVAW